METQVPSLVLGFGCSFLGLKTSRVRVRVESNVYFFFMALSAFFLQNRMELNLTWFSFLFGVWVVGCAVRRRKGRG
jgi:hypothetical protein